MWICQGYMFDFHQIKNKIPYDKNKGWREISWLRLDSTSWSWLRTSKRESLVSRGSPYFCMTLKNLITLTVTIIETEGEIQSYRKKFNDSSSWVSEIKLNFSRISSKLPDQYNIQYVSAEVKFIWCTNHSDCGTGTRRLFQNIYRYKFFKPYLKIEVCKMLSVQTVSHWIRDPQYPHITDLQAQCQRYQSEGV